MMKDVRLSPLEWENFNVPPKLMKISNSGMTAVMSGKWQGPRPYLSKGPVTGRYVFSQLHFHWGRTFHEGSEHRLDGLALPLEVHVMFFKNIYENQDDAMTKTDGTVTIAYFFKMQEEDNEDLGPIMAALPHITRPFASFPMEPVPFQQFMPFFSSDYFMYWGNVYRMHVLWIISRRPIGISQNQLALFRNLLDANNKPIEKNFRDPRDLNNRVVFHVNPSEHQSDILLPMDSGNTKHAKVTNSNHESLTASQEDNLGLKNNHPEGVHMEDILSFSLSKSPNVAELKFKLAKTLLELEKKESSDYGILENYIKAKFAAQKKQTLNPFDNVSVKSEASDHTSEPIDCFHMTNNTVEGVQSTEQKKMNVIDDIYPNDDHKETDSALETEHPLSSNPKISEHPLSSNPNISEDIEVDYIDINSESKSEVSKKSSRNSMDNENKSNHDIDIGNEISQRRHSSVAENINRYIINHDDEEGLDKQQSMTMRSNEDEERNVEIRSLQSKLSSKSLKTSSRKSISRISNLTKEPTIASTTEVLTIPPLSGLPKRTVSFVATASLSKEDDKDEKKKSNEGKKSPLVDGWIEENKLERIRRRLNKKVNRLKMGEKTDDKSLLKTREVMTPETKPNVPNVRASPEKRPRTASKSKSRFSIKQEEIKSPQTMSWNNKELEVDIEKEAFRARILHRSRARLKKELKEEDTQPKVPGTAERLIWKP